MTDANKDIIEEIRDAVFKAMGLSYELRNAGKADDAIRSVIARQPGRDEMEKKLNTVFAFVGDEFVGSFLDWEKLQLDKEKLKSEILSAILLAGGGEQKPRWISAKQEPGLANSGTEFLVATNGGMQVAKWEMIGWRIGCDWIEGVIEYMPLPARASLSPQPEPPQKVEDKS